MVFDVMIREGYNDDGKVIIKVDRVHQMMLSSYLRREQDEGKYVFAVIPLFKKKTFEDNNGGN